AGGGGRAGGGGGGGRVGGGWGGSLCRPGRIRLRAYRAARATAIFPVASSTATSSPCRPSRHGRPNLSAKRVKLPTVRHPSLSTLPRPPPPASSASPAAAAPPRPPPRAPPAAAARPPPARPASG